MRLKYIAYGLTIALIALPAIAQTQFDSEEGREIERLTLQIKSEPSAEAYGRRGLAYEKIGMLQKAESDYGESIRLAPGEPRYRWLRGMALSEQNKFKEALVDCDEVLKMANKGDDDYMQALRIQTRCFEKLHQEQDMLAAFKELSALGDSTATAALERWNNDHKNEIEERLAAKQIPRSIAQWSDPEAPPWPAIEKVAAAMEDDEPRLGKIHIRASVALILIRDYPDQLKRFRKDPINTAMNPANGPELLAAYLAYVSRGLEQGKKPVFLKQVYWESIQKLWKEGKTNDALALSYHPELGEAQIQGVNRYLEEIKSKEQKPTP